MKDYDVNEGEFQHLPANMQATNPPSVQEVEKNERLHKESWLAVTMEEEVEKVKNEDTTNTVKQEETQSWDGRFLIWQDKKRLGGAPLTTL